MYINGIVFSVLFKKSKDFLNWELCNYILINYFPFGCEKQDSVKSWVYP